MRKVIILLSVFILSGCTLISTLTIDQAINKVISNENIKTNTDGKGFKYYKPRDFSLLADNDYNHILVSNGNKFYLSIDINSYYNKIKSDYVIDNSLYYSNRFSYEDKTGFIEVSDANNGYFYVKMLYNYSYIEVSVLESEVKKAIIDAAIILSSISYNDKVIDNLISSGDLQVLETTYEIKKPIKENNKNILDVYQYDTYQE